MIESNKTSKHSSHQLYLQYVQSAHCKAIHSCNAVEQDTIQRISKETTFQTALFVHLRFLRITFKHCLLTYTRNGCEAVCNQKLLREIIVAKRRKPSATTTPLAIQTFSSTKIEYPFLLSATNKIIPVIQQK